MCVVLIYCTFSPVAFLCVTWSLSLCHCGAKAKFSVHLASMLCLVSGDHCFNKSYINVFTFYTCKECAYANRHVTIMCCGFFKQLM